MEKKEIDISKALGTLKQIQIDAYRDILNGAITVLITLVFVIILPYILVLILRTESNLVLDFAEIIASSLIFYVSISRLGFMIWDIWRIAGWTNIRAINLEETSRDPKLYNHLRKEDSIVKKLLSLTAISLTLVYLQFSSKILTVLKIVNPPSIFISEPTLIFLPLHVIILFSIVYDIPILTMLHEKIRHEILEDKIVQSLFKENKCPICEKLIPKKAIHCPYCGTKIRAGETNA